MGHGAGAVPLSISRPPTGGDRMEFRILTERDAEAFHHLYREALQTYPEAFYRTPEEGVGTVEEVAAFLRERGGPDDFVLGAFGGETLVGMVGFVRNTVVKTRHRGHIWGMYVRPDRQGRGIAYRLMEALINRAKTCSGLEQITLTVVSENRPAKALYAKWGFQKYGTYPRSLRGNGRALDEDYMVLFLKSDGS